MGLRFLLSQPVGLAIRKHDGHVNARTIDSEVKELLYVLDTGNGRIKVLSQNSCSNSPFTFVKHIEEACLDNRAGTSIALTPCNNSILVSNWRTKFITELSLDGEFVRHFSHRDFVEPTYLAVNSKGEILVADNGAHAVFLFHPVGKLSRKITNYITPTTTSYAKAKTVSTGVIGAIGFGPNDEIIIASSHIQIFSSSGEIIREVFKEGRNKGHYGGLAYDGKGNLLATRVEKAKSFVQIFDYISGQLKFTLDSSDAKLKRPSCLVTTKDDHVIVADLGNDCIKKYRYL